MGLFKSEGLKFSSSYMSLPISPTYLTPLPRSLHKSPSRNSGSFLVSGQAEPTQALLVAAWKVWDHMSTKRIRKVKATRTSHSSVQ